MLHNNIKYVQNQSVFYLLPHNTVGYIQNPHGFPIQAPMAMSLWARKTIRRPRPCPFGAFGKFPCCWSCDPWRNFPWFRPGCRLEVEQWLRVSATYYARSTFMWKQCCWKWSDKQHNQYRRSLTFRHSHIMPLRRPFGHYRPEREIGNPCATRHFRYWIVWSYVMLSHVGIVVSVSSHTSTVQKSSNIQVWRAAVVTKYHLMGLRWDMKNPDNKLLYCSISVAANLAVPWCPLSKETLFPFGKEKMELKLEKIFPFRMMFWTKVTRPLSFRTSVVALGEVNQIQKLCIDFGYFPEVEAQEMTFKTRVAV